MARPKSNGPYAKLSATYYLDDAILDAGPEAELLFARCLAFTAASNSDGFITERQMKTVGIGLRNLPRRTESLLRVGVLVHGDGGYSIRSWLRWNKSAADIGRELKRDRERKAQKHGEEAPNSAWNEGGIPVDSGSQYKSSQDKASQKNSSSDVADAPIRPEIISLLDLLDAEIERNGAKKPSRTKKNIDAARLLLERDGKTPEQVAAAIRWCQTDEFWRSNILSMSKLREKYDALSLAAKKSRPGAPVTPIRRDIPKNDEWMYR